MVGPPFCDRTLAIAEDDTMENQTSVATPTPAGCLLRMVWMLVGNGALYLSLVLIAANKAPLPSSLDAIAALAVLVMLVARRVDITRFGGRTVQDEPATLAHWRRYAMKLTAIAGVSWALAHFFAGNLTT